MICKRCGSECPDRSEGYCFHCLVGLGSGLIDKQTNLPIRGVREGFPDWQVPPLKREDEMENKQDELLLTDEELHEFGLWDDVPMLKRAAQAQLAEACPIIEKQERERIFNKVEKYHRDEGGLELLLSWRGIVIGEGDWQALKEER